MAMMRRQSPTLWISVLAAILAGPMVRQTAAELWPGEAGLRGVDSPTTAVGLGLPAARFQKALHPRLSYGWQGDRVWLHPSPGPEAWLIPFGPLHASSERYPDPLTESARHFPLFPTGPPSHS